MDMRTFAGKALRQVLGAPTVEGQLPEGRMVELPGRGHTFVVDVPGPEGAPTLVLLHALGCTGYLSWFPALPHLSREYRVVLFDQRWHGRGIRSPHFRLKDCADDVAAVADAIGLDTFVPVGYSMGGAVAQLAWRRHRDRVDGLVLCSTARNFRGKRSEKLFFPMMTATMLPLAAYCRARVERHAARLPDLPDTVADPRWAMGEFRSTSAWTAPAVLTEIGRFNSARWLPEVDVPTAVVVTKRDRAIPARRQYRLAGAIPGATVHEVDAGHAALVMKAEAWVPVFTEACASVRERIGGGVEPEAAAEPAAVAR